VPGSFGSLLLIRVGLLRWVHIPHPPPGRDDERCRTVVVEALQKLVPRRQRHGKQARNLRVNRARKHAIEKAIRARLIHAKATRFAPPLLRRNQNVSSLPFQFKLPPSLETEAQALSVPPPPLLRSTAALPNPPSLATSSHARHSSCYHHFLSIRAARPILVQSLSAHNPAPRRARSHLPARGNPLAPDWPSTSSASSLSVIGISLFLAYKFPSPQQSRNGSGLEFSIRFVVLGTGISSLKRATVTASSPRPHREAAGRSSFFSSVCPKDFVP